MTANNPQYYGILPVNKPAGKMSFSLITQLRRLLNIKTIGHAGTLDPFATGVMILLIGKPYTRLSDQLLTTDKAYEALLHLGSSTDSYDVDGTIVNQSDKVPSLQEIQAVLEKFQGTIEQIPPMYSAKKQGGQKLYDLARKGIEVERPPIQVKVKTTFISYHYPYLKIHVQCSKGTYIRTIGHDIGIALGSFAHLKELTRTQSGAFSLESCLDGALLYEKEQKASLLDRYLVKDLSNVNRKYS